MNKPLYCCTIALDIVGKCWHLCPYSSLTGQIVLIDLLPLARGCKNVVLLSPSKNHKALLFIHHVALVHTKNLAFSFSKASILGEARDTSLTERVDSIS